MFYISSHLSLEDDAQKTCSVCLLKLKSGQQITNCGEKHLKRKAAEVCSYRTMDKRPDLKAGMSQLRKSDPAKHAGVVTSLATKEKYTRTPDDRARALTFVEEMVASIKIRRKRRVLMLPKRQFVAWQCHNLMIKKSQARAMWQETPSHHVHICSFVEQ